MSLPLEFFRHCPGCGKRFHVKIEDEKLVEEHRTREEGPIVPGNFHRAYLSGEGLGPGGGQALVRMPDLVLDVKEYRIDYKCELCGHQWSETRQEEKRES